MNNINNNVAMVTGASKGIGAAVSYMLAEENISELILVARASQEFNDLKTELKKNTKISVHCYEVDLLQQNEVNDFIANVISSFKNVDILINNAGLTIPKTIFESSLEELMSTMQVNLYTPFQLIQSLLKSGNKFQHIVNIASTAGIKGRAGWSTYSSSKAALTAFSESLREELLPLGTRVSCISPGRCATSLRRVLAPNEDQSTIMQPEDVANVIKLLLSDVGHFIDSENMVVRL
ncbi:SDR family oxidoreductase [Shewanella electrodiphila]|uniref:SDR family oxidoreductase n=1 Tax=Shewanella electrodiphila TaxID=934143 RepID=A0ABT0KKI2_9GAMM|nr:SDR family oxidoreductase [Shewanella electrodiphila]MCL1044129.1 SDR family oxidoreductase [Shewanella electrodiphila]